MSYIEKIELLRTQILLAPLDAQTELKLRFESTISTIYWSVSMSGNSLTKNEIEKIIMQSFPFMTSTRKKTTSNPEEKMVLRYKKALDYLKNTWYVTPTPVRLHDLLTLASITETKNIKKESLDLSLILSYLHKSNVHPIIQAAIAQMQMICMAPFTDGNGRIARLLGLLYLYKYGYDFRGMLILDEYWRRDLASLEVIKDTVLKNNSLNSWLEYYTQGMFVQLEKSLTRIRSLSFQVTGHSDYYNLNDRQRLIVSVLDFPQATITNKKVQNHFHVSQITASRDLARLSNLGLVVPHGKGRSVYYTRV